MKAGLACAIASLLAACQAADPERIAMTPLLAWCHSVVTCRAIDWRIGFKYGPAILASSRYTCRCGEAAD